MTVHEVQWYLCGPRNFAQPLHDLMNTFEVSKDSKRKGVLWLVDACHEWELKGLCFMYGVEPNFHIIRDGRAVRFLSDDTWHYFIYPYDPIDLQLSYTPVALVT